MGTLAPPQVKPEAAAAAAPQPAPGRAHSLGELRAWADGCHEMRADRAATDDCVPTAVQLLRCLRAGRLVTEPVARETGADFAWERPDEDPESPESRAEFKKEPVPWAPNAVVGSLFFNDSGCAPELNLRADVPEFCLQHEGMTVMVLQPSAVPAEVLPVGTTGMVCATADSITAQIEAYSQTAPGRVHDFGVVTVLAEVPTEQFDSQGMHQHMLVYYCSASTGLLFLDPTQATARRRVETDIRQVIASLRQRLGQEYRADCIPFCGVWAAAATQPPGSGRAAKRKMIPVVDSSEEDSADSEDEESGVESGGDARRKRRRRGQQQGRPISVDSDSFGQRGGARRQPGRAAKRKVPVIDSSDEEELGTSSGEEDSGGSEEE